VSVRIHPTHAALLFAFAGTLVLGVIPRFAPDTAPELAMVTGFALEFFLGMLAFAFASISGPGVLQRLGLGPSRIPWGTCFVLVVGTLLLSFSLNGLYEFAGFADEGALAQFESDLSGVGGWTIVLAIVSFGLAPGFAEELLCRGLIQRGLQARMGPAAAVCGAALLFGALHVEPIYAALAAVLGAYLGVITLVGGSIRPSILCHSVNNLVAVLSATWGLEIGTDASWASTSLVLAFLLAAAALAWAWRSLGGIPSAVRRLENTGIGLQPERESDDG
jgi:membrane protease YdiL (CAAX protease family)